MSWLWNVPSHACVWFPSPFCSWWPSGRFRALCGCGRATSVGPAVCVPMCACSKWSEYVHVLLCGVTPASFHSISTDACLRIPCSRPCSYCQSRSCMHAFRHPMYVESGRMCPSVSGSRLKVHPRPSRRRTSSSSRLRHVPLCAWTIAC